jgi:polysaccharide export outer membrane protein
MAENKFALRQGLIFLLIAALPPVMMLAPADAQTAGSSAISATASSLASSTGKAANAGQSQGPTIVPRDFSELRIAPGDLLSVNVYDAPDLTNSYRVDPAGGLTIPFCGKVNLRGLSLEEAARRLEAALKEGQILLQPQVSVDVLQYSGQYVTVTGEVANPGRVALIASTTLSEILAETGGVTALAGAHILIRHGADDAAPEEDIAYSRNRSNSQTATILVRPGDSVIVPRAGIVYVLGAVNRPGGYVMQEDGKMNVAEALALSGGTQMQANTGGLRVIRRNPDGTVLDFPLSYDGIAKGTQTPLQLQAQDIVYVPMSKLKATFSSAQGLIGTAASATIYAAR